MTPRRELRLAVALCLLGSLLVLWAVGRTWLVEVDGSDLTIGGARTDVPGTGLAEGVRPLGFVGLAGVVAVAATRRWGRVLVGAAVLGAGLGVVLDVSEVLARPRNLTSPGWAWLTLAGGAVLGLAGALVAVRGRRWGGLSPSYDAPGAHPGPPVTDKGTWDALDRGDDPTA